MRLHNPRPLCLLFACVHSKAFHFGLHGTFCVNWKQWDWSPSSACELNPQKFTFVFFFSESKLFSSEAAKFKITSSCSSRDELSASSPIPTWFPIRNSTREPKTVQPGLVGKVIAGVHTIGVKKDGSYVGANVWPFGARFCCRIWGPWLNS